MRFEDFSKTFPAMPLRLVGTADTDGDCEKNWRWRNCGKSKHFAERFGPERSRCRQLQLLAWNQVSPPASTPPLFHTCIHPLCQLLFLFPRQGGVYIAFKVGVVCFWVMNNFRPSGLFLYRTLRASEGKINMPWILGCFFVL